jgi:transposase InsO family protein
VTVGAATGQLPGAQGQLGEGGCVTEHERLVYHTVLAAEAEVVEYLGGQVVDILEDSNVLLYMRANGLAPGELGGAERRRVKRRARQYELNGDVVVRMMADGTRRIVPAMDKRVDLINQTHAKTGHWGVRRTKGLLLSSYWWQGLEKDVARVLANCEVCGQVKATFNVADPQLHPLPISGMHYRWGCDMAGPFSPSARGNTYVMVCIEHFTKHVELIAVPDKTAETTAYAFLSHVLGRFGSCAEVVTDRGSEFLGAFHQLLEESMIDHRMTSASHPQADGLAERCVQSVKMALAKCVLDEGTVLHWDEQLQWIALGYRSSKQKASGFSPYSLMYGCEPCVPPAVKDRYRPGLALSFDTPEHQQQAAVYILMRAELLQRNCTVAMHNLQSAQHRDTLRYRQVRSGLYRPSLFKFNVGDYVYVRRQNASNTLMSEARPGIFRCLEVRDSGVLVLQGKCGSTMEVNQQNCAPCMLMNIDGRFDHSLRVPGADEHCVVCESADDEAIMLMCDGCGKGYHTYCLMPPLSHVPDVEVWVCPQCEGNGVLVQQILDQQVAAGLVPQRPNQGLMFPNAAQRVADAKASQLDGQSVWFRQGGEWVQGTLRFVHRHARPDAFARRPIRVQGMRGGGQWQTEVGARKLLAAGAARPGAVAAAAVVLPVDGATVWVAAMATESGGTGAVAAAQLPASFDLGTVGGCLAAGALLFQGDMSEGEAAELHHRMANVRQQEVHGLFGQGLLEWGTALLLRAVNLSSCVRLCTPCCHYGDMAVVQEGLQDRYRRDLLSPDVGPAAPCLPSFYKGQNRQSPLEWAFLFVPAGMEEVALAVAADGVSVGVAMLCHRSFMTSGPSYRQRLLQSYMDAGRLVVVSQRGQEYGWVCVFATDGDLSSMCGMPRVGALCELVV